MRTGRTRGPALLCWLTWWNAITRQGTLAMGRCWTPEETGQVLEGGCHRLPWVPADTVGQSHALLLPTAGPLMGLEERHLTPGCSSPAQPWRQRTPWASSPPSAVLLGPGISPEGLSVAGTQHPRAGEHMVQCTDAPTAPSLSTSHPGHTPSSRRSTWWRLTGCSLLWAVATPWHSNSPPRTRSPSSTFLLPCPTLGAQVAKKACTAQQSTVPPHRAAL